MKIERRKGTPNPSLIPLDPEEMQESGEMHILPERILSRILMHEEVDRSDGLDTSEAQPWGSHSKGFQEEA